MIVVFHKQKAQGEKNLTMDGVGERSRILSTLHLPPGGLEVLWKVARESSEPWTQ